jgi:protease IV
MKSWTILFVLLLGMLATSARGANNSPTTSPSVSPPTTQPNASKSKELTDKSTPTTEPAAPKVAYIDMSAPLVEKPADFNFFSEDQTLTLRSVLDRLEQARKDADIKAVLITIGDEPNLAQALELRNELLSIRKAGKRVFVYADAYETPSYIMASGASDVCMLGGGEIMMPGVGLETMFAKGLLDKIGVEADFEQIGEYKGADEEFIHTEPSPELRGELNKLVDSLYGEIVLDIGKDRHLSDGDVRQIVDDALIEGKQAKERGLVDHLVDIDGMRDLMSQELGAKIDLVHDYGKSPQQAVDLSSPFAFFSIFNKKADVSEKQAIGLIYAEGEIIDGSAQQGLFGGSDQIGSDDIRKALRMAERDDHISAVVIRIDSPGGSALASEAMWQGVRRLQQTKPVIISVGSMAASGGYYLASSGNYIFADPSAIVGSIGVVGGKFVYRDLFAKVGLNTAVFERGANAGLFGSDAPWTDGQRKLVHDWMYQTYLQFTQRVMSTRKGKIEDIDKVARGRIYLAQQAKSLGLVDAIGGVQEAVAYAAKQADLAEGSYDVRVVPAPKTLADFFSGGDDTQTTVNPDSSAAPLQMLLATLSPDDRQMLCQEIQTIQIFQRRPVALVCPYQLRVR